MGGIAVGDDCDRWHLILLLLPLCDRSQPATSMPQHPRSKLACGGLLLLLRPRNMRSPSTVRGKGGLETVDRVEEHAEGETILQPPSRLEFRLGRRRAPRCGGNGDGGNSFGALPFLALDEGGVLAAEEMKMPLMDGASGKGSCSRAWESTEGLLLVMGEDMTPDKEIGAATKTGGGK